MRPGRDATDDRDVTQRLSELLSSLTEADHLRDEPPPDLWHALDDRMAHDDAVMAVEEPPRVVAELEGRRARRADRPRGRVLLGVAAALVVVALGAFAGLRSRPPTERLLASAQLEQLEPLGSTTASARLVAEDGETRIVLVATQMPPAPSGERYELWLIDEDLRDPQLLGVVSGSGQVTLPPSVDPRTHPIVDISLEPDDGDRSHSGRSLMRGALH